MNVARLIAARHLDDWSSIDSPIHGLDPRAKLITTLVFMICVMSFPRYELAALVPFALYPVVICLQGLLPLRHIARVILFTLPLAILIGIFNPILDTTPVIQVGPLSLSGGWLSLSSIMLRYVLTLSAVLALVGSTGIHRLCGGLAQLGMPRVLALQMLFLHRYLFVIGDEALRMKRGAAIRMTAPALPLSAYAPLVGSLFLRALARAGRVYQAMLARGFDGSFRLVDRTAPQRSSLVFVLGWCGFFIIARRWNLPHLLGDLIQRGLS